MGNNPTDYFYDKFRTFLIEYKISGDENHLSYFVEEFANLRRNHEVESRMLLRMILNGAVSDAMNLDLRSLDVVTSAVGKSIPNDNSEPYKIILSSSQEFRDRYKKVMDVVFRIAQPVYSFQEELDEMRITFDRYDEKVREFESLSVRQEK